MSNVHMAVYLVSLKIDDSRILGLVDDMLKRAFVNYIQTMLEVNRGIAPKEARANKWRARQDSNPRPPA